jgi:hypothetical protein
VVRASKCVLDFKSPQTQRLNPIPALVALLRQSGPRESAVMPNPDQAQPGNISKAAVVVEGSVHVSAPVLVPLPIPVPAPVPVPAVKRPAGSTPPMIERVFPIRVEALRRQLETSGTWTHIGTMRVVPSVQAANRYDTKVGRFLRFSQPYRTLMNTRLLPGQQRVHG